MWRRLAFIKHMLWAVVWLICLVCCIEVVLRVHTYLGQKPVTGTIQLEHVICHQTHHHLKPLETVTLHHPDTGHTFRESLNSFGLRGPEPSLTKSEDVIRILCLGDEMTFGPGLTTRELFTTHLENMLQDYLPGKLEVINAGIPDYCPLLSLLQYRHRLRSLSPDVIVLSFEMGDVADDYRVRSLTSLDKHGLPLGCPHPLLKKESELKKLQDHFQVAKWLKVKSEQWQQQSNYDSLDQIDHPVGRFAWIRDNLVDWTTYLQNALEPIGQLGDLASSQGAIVILSAIPAPWQVSPLATSDPATRKKYGVAANVAYSNREPFNQLAIFANESGEEYLDISLDFQQVGNPEELYLKTEPWLSARGHEVYATLLARTLYPLLISRPANSSPVQSIQQAGGSRPAPGHGN